MLIILDFGGEFGSKTWHAACAENRLDVEMRLVFDHVNAVEASHRVLQEAAIPAFLASGLPDKFWLDSFVTAAAQVNARMITDMPDSPYLRLFTEDPCISALLSFGCTVIAYNNSPHPRLAGRGVVATYLGPDPLFGVMAVRVLVNNHVRRLRSFHYQGEPTHPLPQPIVLYTTTILPDTGISPIGPNVDTPSSPHATVALAGTGDTREEYVDIDGFFGEPLTSEPRDGVTTTFDFGCGLGRHADNAGTWTTALLEDLLTSDPFAANFALNPVVGGCAPAGQAFVLETMGSIIASPYAGEYRSPTPESAADAIIDDDAINTIHEADPETAPDVHIRRDVPKSFAAAMRGPDRDAWAIAFTTKRLDLAGSFADGQPAFERVPRAAAIATGVEIKDTVVVLYVSRHGEKKPRWCINGKRPTGCIKSPAASSPGCLSSTVILALALAATFDWDINQFDVVQAYLLANPRKYMYARYPHGFCEYLRVLAKGGPIEFEPNDYLMRVRKNVYGDDEAGAVWYELIATFLMRDLGFSRLSIDRCLFVHAITINGMRVVCIILLYVDDLLIIGDRRAVAEFSTKLCERFPTTAGGQDYLGLEITCDSVAGTVFVSQSKYAEKLVANYGLEDCKMQYTPLPNKWTAFTTEIPTGKLSSVGLHYRVALGSLGWLVKTRPDIRYAYSALASAAAPSAAMPDAPNAAHYAAMARVMRYVKSTKHRGLFFRRSGGIRL